MTTQAIIDVIDDNSDIRRMLELVLTANGFNVRPHESAQTFLGTQRSAEPRLLILDVRMPGMTGPELYSRLRDQGENHPVIFMSGECLPHETANILSSKPIAFLWKPFNTQQLLEAIEQGFQQLAMTS